MAKWSIDNVIQNSDDGTIKLDLYQGQHEYNPTDDKLVRQIINKDGLDLDKVTSIDLTFCKLITDETLNIIAQKCSRLEELSVIPCSNAVTDEGIRTILMSNPNLKALNFSGCKKVRVDIINAIITHTPNMTWISARSVGWSVIPDDIDFGTLNKLEEFTLFGNEIKKLPQSMANLPHNCKIFIGRNPLESPPRKMANGGPMSPATIGRFYAEEMCAKADFSLDMLDSHVKEYGVNGLDEVRVNGKTLVDHLSSVGEDTPERREYQERLTIVSKDKK